MPIPFAGLTIMCAAALVATKEAEQAVSTVTLGPVRPRAVGPWDALRHRPVCQGTKGV